MIGRTLSHYRILEKLGSGGIPHELERIIRKCLEKEPDRRYQSGQDLIVDLRNLQRDSGPAVVSTMHQQRAKLSRFWPAAAAMIAALTLGVVVFEYLRTRNTSAIRSIAVLPFVNAGHDPQFEYLSDGITESTINSLSQLRQLRVMARSTVFAYKGKQADPRQVGHDLGVDAVVTGSTPWKMRRSATRLLLPGGKRKQTKYWTTFVRGLQRNMSLRTISA